MALDTNGYKAILQGLLPTGLIWPRDSEAILSRVLEGAAVELARVDGRAEDLVDEADPRATLEMLTDWERVCGLPGECADVSLQTLWARRAALVARLTYRGGQSRQYFIDLAAAHGYQVTITEFKPFKAGQSKAGDRVNGEAWAHAWRVEAPETTIFPFRAGASQAGDRLREWGNETLECVITARAPAHTAVLFGYGA